MIIVGLNPGAPAFEVEVIGVELFVVDGVGGNDDLEVSLGLGHHSATIQDAAGLNYDLITSSELPDIRYTGIDTFEFDEDGDGDVEVTYITNSLIGAKITRWTSTAATP